MLFILTEGSRRALNCFYVQQLGLGSGALPRVIEALESVKLQHGALIECCVCQCLHNSVKTPLRHVLLLLSNKSAASWIFVKLGVFKACIMWKQPDPFTGKINFKECGWIKRSGDFRFQCLGGEKWSKHCLYTSFKKQRGSLFVMDTIAESHWWSCALRFCSGGELTSRSYPSGSNMMESTGKSWESRPSEFEGAKKERRRRKRRRRAK